MSTLPTADVPVTQTAPHGDARTVVFSFAVCLPSMPADTLVSMIQQLQEVFSGETMLIASPNQMEETPVVEGSVRLVPYPLQRGESEWVLNGADYIAAARLSQERGIPNVLLLGSEAATLNAEGLRSLRQSLTEGADLGTARYRTGPQEALVNSALLYPLNRALFGANVRFPLPLDAALSQRMLARLTVVANRAGMSAENGLLWPVSEAVTAGFSVREAEAVERVLPRPQEADLNVLFPTVTSSLFADIEAKATYWQRPRVLPPLPRDASTPNPREGAPDAEEIRSLVEGFRLAFANLREIWSLVLPPQSLLSLKKLSLSPVESFSFPANLWARVVYDFGLAFHLRTLNRGHLLGSMTPLYLAWVASLLQSSRTPAGSVSFLEETARAFEQEKPYLVSRWRWPDRFNP